MISQRFTKGHVSFISPHRASHVAAAGCCRIPQGHEFRGEHGYGESNREVLDIWQIIPSAFYHILNMAIYTDVFPLKIVLWITRRYLMWLMCVEDKHNTSACKMEMKWHGCGFVGEIECNPIMAFFWWGKWLSTINKYKLDRYTSSLCSNTLRLSCLLFVAGQPLAILLPKFLDGLSLAGISKIPSGNDWHNYGKIHHVQWTIPLKMAIFQYFP